jgi:branched-chain amino acid aminotransferase
VYDHGVLYGDGVFEGIRIYNGKVLKKKTHLIRLFESADHICMRVPYSRKELDAAITETITANGLSDGYIRLCVTRGAGYLGLNPHLCENPSVFIIADTITLYPPEMYAEGMEIITAATIRNHPAALSPRVKSLNYLNNIMAKIEAIQAGAPEALMLNHLGYVAECTGDNVFMIRHHPDGQEKAVIYTPPINAGILEGVTRNLVIEMAEQAGYEVKQIDLTRHDLFTADEVFLTGTAAEVIPVVKLDTRQIGDGKPGPVSKELIAAFRELVKDAPED